MINDSRDEEADEATSESSCRNERMKECANEGTWESRNARMKERVNEGTSISRNECMNE